MVCIDIADSLKEAHADFIQLHRLRIWDFVGLKRSRKTSNPGGGYGAHVSSLIAGGYLYI